jgi:hypothetical protein
VNYLRRSAVPIPDAFDGSLVQMLAHLFERSGDNGAGRRPALPPPEMASGRTEASILDEHRDGASNLQVALALLLGAAALAGRRAPVQRYWCPGETLGKCEVGVDCLARFAQVALAQILKRDIGEFLDDEIGRRGGITHRRPPADVGHWRAVA